MSKWCTQACASQMAISILEMKNVGYLQNNATRKMRKIISQFDDTKFQILSIALNFSILWIAVVFDYCWIFMLIKVCYDKYHDFISTISYEIAHLSMKQHHSILTLSFFFYLTILNNWSSLLKEETLWESTWKCYVGVLTTLNLSEIPFKCPRKTTMDVNIQLKL